MDSRKPLKYLMFDGLGCLQLASQSVEHELQWRKLSQNQSLAGCFSRLLTTFFVAIVICFIVMRASLSISKDIGASTEVARLD